MKKKILNSTIKKKQPYMSSTSDFFSTSSTDSNYMDNVDITSSTSNDSYTITTSYNEPDIMDRSDAKLSWSSIDYGGQTVNDGLF